MVILMILMFNSNINKNVSSAANKPFKMVSEIPRDTEY